MPSKIEITELGLNGQGVGSDPEGNLYFVPYAIPGDKVRIKEISRKGRFVDAELIEVKKASPDRVSPPCRYFGECGGCDLQHMDYPAQVKAKDRVLQHVLDRVELKPTEYLPPVPSPQPFHYRNRIQLHQQEGQWGFYKKNSRDWMHIEECLIANEEINRAIKSSDLTVLAHDSFQQVNDAQNEYLKESAKKFVEKKASKKILELYCGSGNLSFATGNGIEKLVGVDLSEAAIEKANAHQDPKRHFVAKPVDSKLIAQLPQEFVSSYDTLILDPPRTGVGKCITTFLNPSLKSIFYVSCSPVTFSHDAKKLVEKGFTLNSVQLVDMFPQTHHIELIAEFSR